MDLKKLFSVQKVLRDRINYNEPDRFDKLVLALLVEVGECANEWRGFKFWSKDQEPRISKHELCEGPGEHGPQLTHKNPLLEEYVDGLHFIIEIGIEIDIPHEDWALRARAGRLRYKEVDKFTDIYKSIVELADSQGENEWVDLFEHYSGLGEMLGFTWGQIEKAYLEKNEVNHARQDNGY